VKTSSGRMVKCWIPKFESDLVYAPCHHGKMIAASHSLVNTMITEHP
jgi:hypothetical protein